MADGEVVNRDQNMTGSKTNASRILIGTSCAQILLRCICCSSRRTNSTGKEMGKKSKRRGEVGGGGKKTDSGRDADQPLVPHEALMQVTAPKSLKGIFSTNDEPTCCVFCHESLWRNYLFMLCCGKVCCRNCPAFIVDMRGKERCAFCNTLSSKRMAILQSEAKLGKSWAEMFLGATLAEDGMHSQALTWYARSAIKGNFDAFLELSEVYCQGKGVPQDLKLSEAYARKARALNPDCGLPSNYCLEKILDLRIDAGENDSASTILHCIANETDENALDGYLCGRFAARLWDAGMHQSSAEMYARTFCYGHVEAAHCASYMLFYAKKYALSKLWLDIACLSKSLYRDVMVASTATGEKRTWKDSRSQRDEVRSNLREMRNSCGECAEPLVGSTRKYCRCCRTYCYCNEDCQKRHWANGHREECKEVEEHMRKIQTAIRSGKFDWVNEME